MKIETRFSTFNPEKAREEKLRFIRAYGLCAEQIDAHPEGTKTWRVWDPEKLPEVNMIGDHALDGAIEYLDALHTPKTIDELLARGGTQVSRKYRLASCLPRGMSGMEALKARDPERFKKFMEQMELRAAEEYRTYTARVYGDSFELSHVEFNEFLTKTGRTANKFLETEREGCPGCGSFGHLHGFECREQKKREDRS